MVNGTWNGAFIRSPFTIHYLLFTGLHVLDVQLQLDLAIPPISLQFIGEIEALIHYGRLLRLFNSAPPDGFKRPIVVAGHAQLQMLLFDYLRLAQYAEPAGHEQRARVTGAKWFQRAQLLRKLKTEGARRNFRIDLKRRRQVFFRQTRRRVFIQAAAELRNAFASNRQTGSVRMTAEFVEQIAACRQPVEQVIGFNAPRRTVADVAIERDNHARPMQALGNFRRCQTDHSAMPTVTGDHSRVA